MLPSSSLHLSGLICVDITSDVWSYGFFSLNMILPLSSLVNWATGFSGLLPALYSMEQPKKKYSESSDIQPAASASLPFHQHMGQRKSKEWAGLGHNKSRLAKVPLASMAFHLWVTTALGFLQKSQRPKKPLSDHFSQQLWNTAEEYSWGQSTFYF